ncbi:hypothetical protein M758_11G062200 [Ceratodon purpureus]|nr:hypothetical protein M758_11G062200 [Ceratodon purpureus]
MHARPAAHIEDAVRFLCVQSSWRTWDHWLCYIRAWRRLRLIWYESKGRMVFNLSCLQLPVRIILET